MSDKPVGHESPFEQIRKVNEYGQEYWSARDLMVILDYAEYRNFLPVIKKAMKACDNSGQSIDNHFVQANEMVDIGSNAKRTIQNYQLSRYAGILSFKMQIPKRK